MGTDTSGVATAGRERKAPGRPRSARAEEAIIDAMIDMMAEGTAAEAISIEAVATRAGVGKATIYRRWPNKEALLLEAVTRLKGPLPELAGGSVRDDLIALLRPPERGDASQYTRVFACLASELRRSDEMRAAYRKAAQPRRDLMRQVLQRGIDGGELRPDLDVDLTMTMLFSPFLADTVLGTAGSDRRELARKVVDALWPAIATPSGAQPAGDG